MTKSAAKNAAVAAAITRWFPRNARDLPWRTGRTGYTALVSEAMLQQTQVSRVIEPYRQFMHRFPTVARLAAADEQDVLAMWRGLGYYRRARNLRAAASHIVQHHAGRVPRNVAALMQLPGIGRYTAGAIASIVYQQRVPIVDGNVQRVLLRMYQPPTTSTTQARAWAWQKAAELVEAASKPGTFNEGLMELGATVCLAAPGSPRCGECPLARWCVSRSRQHARRQAQSSSRIVKPQIHHHSVVIHRPRSARIAIEQRPVTGMWGGMWQVPTIEHSQRLDEAVIAQRLGVRALKHVRSFEHSTSHRRVHMHVFVGRTSQRKMTWCTLERLAEVPMSNAQRKVLEWAGITEPPKRVRLAK